MKYTFSLLSIIGLLSLSACSHENQDLKSDDKPIAIKTATASVNPQQHLISASGKMEAIQSANICTRMMGFVSAIHVTTGQKVAKGTLLLTIKSEDLDAKLSQVNASISEANAAVNNARRDFERFTVLFAQQSATQKELDDMTTRYEMAKAHLETAQQMKNEVMAQYQYASLRAPFNGTITNTFVKTGDLANPGMPLLTIETPGETEVTAMVSESDITDVKEGMPATITIKNSHLTLKGKVREVSLSAKNTGGQYLVKLTPDNTPADVLPGMFVNVQLISSASPKKGNGRLMIPTSALVEEGQLTGIYTIGEGGVAVLRWIRTGESNGEQTEVLSGLSDGEQYILSAEGRLFNGSKVTVQ